MATAKTTAKNAVVVFPIIRMELPLGYRSWAPSTDGSKNFLPAWQFLIPKMIYDNASNIAARVAMKLRRVQDGQDLYLELAAPQGWVRVGKCLARLTVLKFAEGSDWASDMLALLQAPVEVRAQIQAAATDIEPATTPESDVVLPFAPRSFRDFMLYEAHAIAAARGFVRSFMPGAAHIVGAYEVLTRRTFPRLKPHALWYRQPVYYMGNHLTFATDGEDIAIPSYTRALDYELELGFVLAQPLRDTTPGGAERAIAGFVVLNDISARDVQLAEMASGFGPQKSKHFRTAMSKVVVTADEILPHWQSLEASVRLNGGLVAETSTAGARWTLGEVLAHASRGEQLHPGELFGTGTLPGGCGIETGRLLEPGDVIELAIEGVGTLANRIVAGGQA
jgi:2-keto-4-pentenoate hydratase/2-oxohepta-3-ene-1,7-dioic acid hydratase in catechol pathway